MKIILNNISSISSKCQREFSSLVARAPETQSQVQVEYKVWAVSSVPYHITLLVMYEEKEKKTGDRKEEVLNPTGVFSLKNGRWEPGMHGARQGPRSVSEELFGSWLLILYSVFQYLSNSTNNHKY